MGWFEHEFDAPVTVHDVGRYRYTVVFMPEDHKRALPADAPARLRVEAEVNDHPLSAAWQPAGDGRRYLMLSKRLLKETELTPGDLATVRYRLADPDAVELPELLETALDRDAAARAGWETLSPGRRRGVAHMIATAKRAATKEARLAMILASLKDPEARADLAAPPSRRRRKA
ncbi:MAG: YdeI/OmpD-associated family protein [Oceanicaulis sp.]